MWQDESSEWEGPATVGEADPGTDIVCLTEQVAGEANLVVELAPQSYMRLCFWQFGGSIVEKRLAASGWEDMGTIPTE